MSVKNEWLDIPEGMVIHKKRPYPVEAFQIAKYPVMVADYRRFWESGAYEKYEFWTRAGWQWRVDHNITSPDYWEDRQLPMNTHPIMGVSWYEAVAYCRWLNEEENDPNWQVTLPTEQQWEWAACGDETRDFPWGNNFDTQFGNSKENGINRTTPVTNYPKGQSFFGVWDMGGNLWEWCANRWQNQRFGITALIGASNSRRALRGGAWDLGSSFLSIASRNNYEAHLRYNTVGFRCVRVKVGAKS